MMLIGQETLRYYKLVCACHPPHCSHSDCKYLFAVEIQSEYWSQKQGARSKMLLLASWIATTGLLKLGAEVTVQLHDGTTFWGTIIGTKGEMKSKTADADCWYTVEDENGKPHKVKRKDLRARVWYTIAQVSIIVNCVVNWRSHLHGCTADRCDE
jgi:hypothetical protein